MATKLNTSNITDSKTAITNYRTACDAEFKKINGIITSLIGENAGFLGDAANGYKAFFDQITPGLTTQLTGTSESITSMLESLLTAVSQMLDPVDPQLKTANENAGQGQAAAPVPTQNT